MLHARQDRIASAIIEMLQTNWQRGQFATSLVSREIAGCDLTYGSDRRVEPEPEVGVDGNCETQEFSLYTEEPLTDVQASQVEQSVYMATGHNLTVETDTDGFCWGMSLEQGVLN